MTDIDVFYLIRWRGSVNAGPISAIATAPRISRGLDPAIGTGNVA
jgi:hypothetical protein